MTTTIFLVDKHDTMRKFLRLLLETQGDLVVVGEATDGLSAFGAVSPCQPDVVVLDLVLPLHDSLAVVQRIRALCPSTQVILLALFLGSEDARQAISAGVQGIALYEEVSNELIKAIHTVDAGECYLSRELVEYAVTAPPLKQAPQKHLSGWVQGGSDGLQNTRPQTQPHAHQL